MGRQDQDQNRVHVFHTSKTQQTCSFVIFRVRMLPYYRGTPSLVKRPPALLGSLPIMPIQSPVYGPIEAFTPFARAARYFAPASDDMSTVREAAERGQRFPYSERHLQCVWRA